MKAFNTPRTYLVERACLLPGDEIETDVIFRVSIHDGEVTDFRHSFNWQLDNWLRSHQSDIENEALEMYRNELHEAREWAADQAERRRKDDSIMPDGNA